MLFTEIFILPNYDQIGTTVLNIPSTLWDFPFDIIQMNGAESVDFLQRISSNDMTDFLPGTIRKTLLITDKGRILDAVWVVHREENLLLLVSATMASEIIAWLNGYIIMEEIELHDVTDKYSVHLHFTLDTTLYRTDYYGFPVTIEISESSGSERYVQWELLDQWRILNGIPKSKKEIVQDFNPLELNLWDSISFTKGCYIGQEVIARLDTYKKIQRTVSLISSSQTIRDSDKIVDESGEVIGKITSVLPSNNGFIGLAVLRVKNAVERKEWNVEGEARTITIEKVFRKEDYGRN